MSDITNNISDYERAKLITQAKVEASSVGAVLTQGEVQLSGIEVTNYSIKAPDMQIGFNVGLVSRAFDMAFYEIFSGAFNHSLKELELGGEVRTLNAEEKEKYPRAVKSFIECIKRSTSKAASGETGIVGTSDINLFDGAFTYAAVLRGRGYKKLHSLDGENKRETIEDNNVIIKDTPKIAVMLGRKTEGNSCKGFIFSVITPGVDTISDDPEKKINTPCRIDIYSVFFPDGESYEIDQDTFLSIAKSADWEGYLNSLDEDIKGPDGNYISSVIIDSFSSNMK